MYGPICVITMQCKMAWSLIQRCKLTVDPKRFAASWTPLAIAEEAQTRRNTVASKILDTINALTSDKFKYYRLLSFARTYADTPSAGAAQTTLKELLGTIRT